MSETISPLQENVKTVSIKIRPSIWKAFLHLCIDEEVTASAKLERMIRERLGLPREERPIEPVVCPLCRSSDRVKCLGLK